MPKQAFKLLFSTLCVMLKGSAFVFFGEFTGSKLLLVAGSSSHNFVFSSADLHAVWCISISPSIYLSIYLASCTYIEKHVRASAPPCSLCTCITCIPTYVWKSTFPTRKMIAVSDPTQHAFFALWVCALSAELRESRKSPHGEA